MRCYRFLTEELNGWEHGFSSCFLISLLFHQFFGSPLMSLLLRTERGHMLEYSYQVVFYSIAFNFVFLKQLRYLIQVKNLFKRMSDGCFNFNSLA